MAADELVPCMDDWCKISPCKCRDAINALIAERDKLQARLAEWRAWACKMEAERDKLRGILCGEFVLWCETHDKPMEECQPDTPQSVPACTCTCTCNPLWDGYDGDCPIHGWFEPHTPDTPQSVPAPEQSFRFIDSGGAALAMKLRERDKLKEEVERLKTGWYDHVKRIDALMCQKDALVERVSVLEAERDKLKGENAVLMDNAICAANVALRAERDRLQDEINTILEIKDKQVNALLAERDKLKEALVCVINLSNNAPDGSALDECNKDARAALRTSEGK
jgi:hypothetical protein